MTYYEQVQAKGYQYGSRSTGQATDMRRAEQGHRDARLEHAQWQICNGADRQKKHRQTVSGGDSAGAEQQHPQLVLAEFHFSTSSHD